MRAGTVTDPRAMSPANAMIAARFAAMSPYFAVHRLDPNNWFQILTGSATTSRTPLHISGNTGTTAGSVARAHTSQVYIIPSVGPGSNLTINWGRPFMFSGLLSCGTGPNTTANGVRRFSIKAQTDAAGDLSARGIQLKISGGTTTAQHILCVHNGTNYLESTPVVAPATAGTILPFMIYSDGAGNVHGWFGSTSLQITDTPTAVVTGGPTTARPNFGDDQFHLEVTNGPDAANHRFELYQLRSFGL
jgi:hypothetical protein